MFCGKIKNCFEEQWPARRNVDICGCSTASNIIKAHSLWLDYDLRFEHLLEEHWRHSFWWRHMWFWAASPTLLTFQDSSYKWSHLTLPWKWHSEIWRKICKRCCQFYLKGPDNSTSLTPPPRRRPEIGNSPFTMQHHMQGPASLSQLRVKSDPRKPPHTWIVILAASSTTITLMHRHNVGSSSSSSIYLTMILK